MRATTEPVLKKHTLATFDPRSIDPPRVKEQRTPEERFLRATQWATFLFEVKKAAGEARCPQYDD